MANYTKQRAAFISAGFQAGLQAGRQQILDMVSLVLRDPEIMGKDVFGAKRLQKVQEAMKKLDKEYSEAWCGSQESDWYQEKLDEVLKRIFGEIVPFRERYPYLKEWDYNKPHKK